MWRGRSFNFEYASFIGNRETPNLSGNTAGCKSVCVGSVARNEENPASDVHLLIELDRQAKVGLMKFASIKFDLKNILKKKVDLLSEVGVSIHLGPFNSQGDDSMEYSI